jgi:hypothetical protein
MRQAPIPTILSPSIERITTREIAPVDVGCPNNTEESQGQFRSYFFDSPLSEIDPFILTSSIPDEFEQFVRSLPTELQLSRGGFVIAHPKGEKAELSLSLIAISDINSVCAGLGIAIPIDNSALYEVSDSNCLKTITPAKELKGNFVERHALVVSGDGCIGMYPLQVDGFTIGVVTLNFSKSSSCYDASEEISLANSKLAQRVAQIAPRIISKAITALDY